MNPEAKLAKSLEWLLGLPLFGNILDQYFIVSSGRLGEVLKTTLWTVIAITMGMLVGQLH